MVTAMPACTSKVDGMVFLFSLAHVLVGSCFIESPDGGTFLF